MSEVLAGSRPVTEVSMAEARLNTGESICGVNDIFVGPRSHTSARYTIHSGGSSERQSSSGIIISTGLGSTGWLRSILTGATGIASAMSGGAIERTEVQQFAWDSDYLFFSVREPWPSRTSSAEIAFGKVTEKEPLTLVSHMPENGIIFSDGMEEDFLQFNAGTEAIISVAEKRGHLVV